MEFRIVQKPGYGHQLFIIANEAALKQVPGLTKEEVSFSAEAFKKEQPYITINQYSRFIFIYLVKSKKTDWQTNEGIRKAGAEFQSQLNRNKIAEITISNLSSLSEAAYLLAEGIALANYQFLKYRK